MVSGRRVVDLSLGVNQSTISIQKNVDGGSGSQQLFDEFLHVFALGEGPCAFSRLVERYGQQYGLETGKAWVHVQAFISEAIRHGLISLQPVAPPPYLGRGHYLELSRLRECWLHTNNSCNLSCGHCLVSSSPKGDPGLSTAFWKDIIDQAAA